MEFVFLVPGNRDECVHVAFRLFVGCCSAHMELDFLVPGSLDMGFAYLEKPPVDLDVFMWLLGGVDVSARS